MPEFISILRWIRDIVYPQLLETNENVKIVADNIEEVKAFNTSIEDGVLPFERIVITVDTINELLELSPSNGDTVIVKADGLNYIHEYSKWVCKEWKTVYSTAELEALDVLIYSKAKLVLDGRSGEFIYDATKSAVNNGGTIFDGWVRQFSGLVNIKWFGAVADGITDDYDAMKLVLLASKDIFIPSGLYKINNTSPIIIGDSVSIKMQNDSFIYPAETVSLFSITGRNVIIDGGVIVGNGTYNSIGSSTGRSNSFIEVYGNEVLTKNQNVILKNIKMVNPNNTGIQLYRTLGVLVSGCILESAYDDVFFQGHFGISIYSSANITISDTKVKGFIENIFGGGNSGFIFNDFSGDAASSFTRNIIINSCLLQKPIDHCIYFASYSKNITISDNSLSCLSIDSGHAIVYTGNSNIINNSIISKNGAIRCRMGYGSILSNNNIEIQGISDGTDLLSAISLNAYESLSYDLDDIIISNNIIKATGTSIFGIYVFSLPRISDGKQNIIKNISITGNTLNNVGGDSTYPYTSAIRISQSKDNVLANTLYSENIKISDNIINAATNCKYGIFLAGLTSEAGADRLQILNNIISNVKVTNILFTGKNSVIKDNLFMPQSGATIIQEITNTETPSSNNFLGKVFGNVDGAEFFISQDTTEYEGREVNYKSSAEFNTTLEGYRPFKKLVFNPTASRTILLEGRFPLKYTVSVSNISATNNLLFTLVTGGPTSTVLPNTTSTFMCIGSNTFIKI